MTHKMTLKQKMTLLVGSALIGLALLAIQGFWQMERVYTSANVGNDNSVPALIALNHSISAFGQVRVRLYRHAVNNDDSKVTFLEKELNDSLKALSNAFKEYEATITHDEDRRLFEADKAAFSNYELGIEPILALSRANKKEQAFEALSNLRAAGRVTQEALENHVSYNADFAKKSTAAAQETKHDATLMSVMLGLIAFAIIGVMGFFFTRTLMQQLGGEPDMAADIANKIAAGDLSSQINLAAGDQTSLMAAMKNMITTLQGLQKELQRLTGASREGQLSERGKPQQFKGAYAEVIVSVNAMLDAILLPIGEGNRILAQISGGKIDELITQTYKGDHENMKVAVNNVATTLQGLQKELQRLTLASREGQLSERGKPQQFKGAYAEVIVGVNDMLDAILLPIGEGNRILSLIRGGNLRERVEITCQGDHDKMKQAINGVHGWLTELIAYVTKLANGDLSAEMAKASADDQVHEWLMLLKRNIQALVTDANALSKAAVEGRLATRADASQHQGDFRKIVEGVNGTLDAVIGPLNVAAGYVDRISKGDIPPKITDTYNGDFNNIKNNLNQAIDAVNTLVTDANALSKAAVEGRLATRADATKHQGDFRKIVEGVNETLDAVIGPLNVAANYVDNISKGNIPAKIVDNYNGEFNVIKNNLNQAIDAVNALVADANVLSKAAIEGRLATRADASKHQGDFRKIVAGVNDTLDAVIGPLNVAAGYVDRISKGDIPPKITDTYNGDFNNIKNNLNQAIDAVNTLVTDANALSKAAIEGRLATRADASKHQGDFRKIVEGVNGTLDAVIGPLNVAAGYVDRISKGDIPPKITDTYNGDFNVIKNNLNQAIDAVNALVTDANALSKAAIEGRLATRADATKHQGDFSKIVEGVNNTLDAVIGPLNVAAGYVDRISKGDIPPKITDAYNGDFNTIKNNLNQAIDAVNSLVADANVLAKAAVEGRLATRADATKHQGDFRKIVEGVNNTLDAVINPLNVAAGYVDRISKGDIPPKITDTYNGDFNTIKNNLNQAIDAVNSLIADANELSRAAVEGRLATRADATKHQGDFRKIVKGVNDTLDAVINPLNVAANYVDRIAKGDTPPKITDTYHGDFNTIKNNLNLAIDAINEQAAAANSIAVGDLTVKINVRSENDILAKSLELMLNNLKAVIADTDKLIKGAAEGQLDLRADASKHQGDYRTMVQGLNQILDGIVLPVNEAIEVLSLVEQGDLTHMVRGDYKGQLRDFKDTVNNTIAKLSETIANVINAADQLGNASEQVGATSQSLSQSSSEQAAGVEETSASIEEMAASINQNAENAQITDGMASKARKEAAEGGVAVKQTVSAMKDIANKIGIVDDIAYQTNMLALNAAIEAARAGEHGKGFAVVAAEVRKLAERSQVAAQEIGELAESSVKTAESAGQLLDAIVPSIAKTSDLVQEIAAASNEQSAGVKQVNTAMAQMNQITQQNASASEELAATAEEMTAQAEQLQTLMSFFKIGKSESASIRVGNRGGKKVEKAKVSLHAAHKESNPETAFNLDEFERF